MVWRREMKANEFPFEHAEPAMPQGPLGEEVQQVVG